MSRLLASIALLSLVVACEEPHGWFNGAPRLAGSVDTGGLCFGFPDLDQDGFGANGVEEGEVECSVVASQAGDCDDANSSVHEGAQEICDGIDSNCNGVHDVNDESAVGAANVYRDADDDGYGGHNQESQVRCVGTGWVTNKLDCNDAQPTVNPAAKEVCDGLDNDCDGRIDVADADLLIEDRQNVWFSDLDDDGFGNADASRCFSADGFVSDSTDCNDGDASINPAAVEACDDVDHDCSGATDDIQQSVVGYVDSDGDGWGSNTAGGTVNTCSGGSLVGRTGDCDDGNVARYPGAPDTPYDGIMNDCSLANSADCDADRDGFQSSQCSTVSPVDCNDTDPLVHPGALQLAFSNFDSDCDGDSGAGGDHKPMFVLDGVGEEVAAADLNGDGVRELVSLRAGTSSGSNATLLRWPANLRAAPNPAPFGSVSDAGRRTFTEPMDLDRDGAEDLLLFTRGESALITQIAGGLSPSVYTSTAGGGQQFVAVGDVDEDGWGDVFVTSWQSGAAAELRHYAVEEFGTVEDLDLNAPTRVLLINAPVAHMADLSVGMVGDMDGDGFEEVGIGIPNLPGDGGDAHGARQILQGPDYSWDDGSAYSGGGPEVFLGRVSALGQGDFNGDGYTDDLTCSVYPTVGTLYDMEVIAFHGHGNLFTPDGTFIYDSFALPTLGTNLEVTLRWAGDVDTDGHDDFWVAYAGDNGSESGSSFFPDAGAHLVFGSATVFNGYLDGASYAAVTPDAELHDGLASGIALLDLDGHEPLDIVLAQDDGGPALFFTGIIP